MAHLIHGILVRVAIIGFCESKKGRNLHPLWGCHSLMQKEYYWTTKGLDFTTNIWMVIVLNSSVHVLSIFCIVFWELQTFIKREARQ